MPDRRSVKGNLGAPTIFLEKRATTSWRDRASLIVLDGDAARRLAQINKTKLVIGRSSLCDLTLNDAAVSAKHVELEVVDDAYLLRDLNSTNGTYVGDVRISEVYLHPGCRFRVGSTVLEFSVDGQVAAIVLSPKHRFGDVAGRSAKMRELFATLEKVAPSDITVLVEGETGTGKERVARSVHNKSRRSARPYVVLDCSAIPQDLMESVVFGHEKGAFTGAVAARKGAFEQAHGGTIFLDEVGELDLSLQPKLLRVLETRELKRVGGEQTIAADARVIAATNRDLRDMVAQGRFREDLYFRLSVVQIEIAPLRQRRDDIALLAQELLDELNDRSRFAEPLRLSTEALEMLQRHRWPGNVRELRNVLERAASLADAPVLGCDDLSMSAPTAKAPRRPTGGATVDAGVDYKTAKQGVLQEFERDYLAQLMSEMAGNISAAARRAGLTRYHLRELLKKHQLVDKFRG